MIYDDTTKGKQVSEDFHHLIDLPTWENTSLTLPGKKKNYPPGFWSQAGDF